ncbi:hypothetical protein CVS30_07080 [Arthrobacter psychrolactophilus]|uniref:Uncharacterized protein n=1 Tax=Arthrobacter psychrolactophilus TaxID=92442 RepID=A0A2V5JGT8_9MICC|nr:hypothetical protein [Arthrobacter psychrolactophilus]PYI39067.1 hypothetical protein CVS30_07080 [Arthrobacter psychrolactophilus]
MSSAGGFLLAYFLGEEESDGEQLRWHHVPEAVLSRGARHGSLLAMTAEERTRLAGNVWM